MSEEEDFEPLDKGALFIFGKSRFCDGEPGRFWIQNDPILQVACGDEHTALITSSGRVFTFGNNEWGQLGQGHTNALTKPVVISSLEKERATVLSCGRSHTLVGTDSGAVYGFGCNSELQLGVSSNHGTICKEPILLAGVNGVKMLAGGAEHSLALTEKGSVFIWGSGSEGQLGLGERTECTGPTELKLDSGVICIGAGYYHSALVTVDGKLWTFGEKEGGKLGLPDNHLKKTNRPQAVSGIIGGKIVWVSCGGHHTIAITADGLAYSFGNGSNGQLGLTSETVTASQPKKVQGLEGIKVARVTCGESHSAFIAEGSQLYMCGDGRHGKLGLLQEDSNQFSPLLISTFANMSVEQVACGGCHTLVLAVERNTSQRANLAARARRREKNLPPLEITVNLPDSNPLNKSRLPEIDKDIEGNDEVQIRKIKRLIKRRSMLKEAEDDDSIRHADSDIEDFELLNNDELNNEEFGNCRNSIRLASEELLSPMYSSNDNLDSPDNKQPSVFQEEPSGGDKNDNHETIIKEEKISTPSRLSRIFGGTKKKSLSQQSSLDKMSSVNSTPVKNVVNNDQAIRNGETNVDASPTKDKAKKKIDKITSSKVRLP